MRTHWWTSLWLLGSVALLGGCASETRIVKNDAAPVKEYGDLYLLAFKNDPRNVQPRVIREFESMGLKVKVVSREEPLAGSLGTGFVISPEGHVLTCAHVLEGEKVATIWVSNVRYEADVVSADEEIDLAVLKPRTPITPPVRALSFRRDQRYSIGADVSTIGYPLGDLLGTSARYTKGSISATTGIQDDPRELQVSAQIQPGSSGSPLFDGEGVVIGVMQRSLDHLQFAKAIGGHLPQNVNFAIKSGVALEFLRTDKTVRDMLSYDLGRGVENLQESVVRVRSGNYSEEWEKTPKLYAVVYYRSIWDIWYRFTLFVIKVYDLDSGQQLFAVGQDRDNKFSTEDVVIRETFAEVSKALRKEQQ